MRQGRCTFPPDASGRICDRLAGLQQVIGYETIRQVLSETGRVNRRACKLTHEVIMWVVLAMGRFTDVPIRQVFKRTRIVRKGEATPGRSTFCHARQRLGVAPVKRLFDRTVQPLATPYTLSAFYKGMRLMGIDGVVFSLPDRPANDATFGRPSGGVRGEGQRRERFICSQIAMFNRRRRAMGLETRVVIHAAIDRAKIMRETRDGRMQEVEIRLSGWVFNAIRHSEVLTWHRDYFRLRKPLERGMYELARKHCGKQDEWRVSLELLQKKCGSASTLKEFRRLVGNIVEEDAVHHHMPDYGVSFSDNGMVIFRSSNARLVSVWLPGPSQTT